MARLNKSRKELPMKWQASAYVRVAGLVMALIFMGISLPFGFTPSENARATATTTIDMTSSWLSYGSIERWDAVYPPVANEVVNHPGTQHYVQHSASPGTYTTERTFIGFDTSSIPTGMVVDSARLFIRTNGIVVTGAWACEVYDSEYTTLDLGDWNDYSIFQGTLMNGTGVTANTWYSLSVLPSSINRTGETQFMLKIDADPASTPTALRGCGFFTNYSAAYPYLEVTYSLKQVGYAMQLTTGAWINGTIFPSIQSWNLTHDLYCFEIDTVPDADNLTIEKDAEWDLGDFAPFGGYTLDPAYLLITDLWDSITYRIWFLVPNGQPSSFIHISLYNAFTGEGIMFEATHIRYCSGPSWDESTASDVTSPDLYLYPYQNYTFRIEDFFGNVLLDYVFMANAELNYLTIPVPAYSWQIFNMNDAPVLMSIYWNNSGSPWQFFVGPHWIIERFLKGGDYTFMVTFYNTDGTAGETVYFNRTVPMTGLNASFVYVTGTTLYEIVSSIEGVMATQLIITSLISPSIVLIYEDMPLAPVKIKALTLTSPLSIDPYLILEATTYQNRTTIAGVNATLWQPYPNVVGATYYVQSDVLAFSGTFASTIYINQTDGTNLYYNTILPATYNLNGENVTVWCNNGFAVSRATVFREITEYVVNYYASEKRYEATLALNNSGPLEFFSPYWFIGFPNYTIIDLESVRVFDLDNGLYLSSHTNFEVSSGGIHLTMNRLNASAQRNLRITYWDLNGTTNLGAPNLVAEAYTQQSLNGASMKYTAVQWTNPYAVQYRGEVYITLNFTYGDSLLPSSITVIDETTGSTIPSSQWIYTGRTIIILTDGVGTVPVGGARNYGIYFTLDVATETDDRSDFFFGPVVINGQQFYISGHLISWAMLLMIVGWVLVFYAYWTDRKDIFAYFVIWGSVTVVLAYFQAMLG